MKGINIILIFLGGWFFLSGGNFDDRILTFSQQYGLMLAILIFFVAVIFIRGIVLSPKVFLFPFLFFYMYLVGVFFGGSEKEIAKVIAFSLVAGVAAFSANRLTLLEFLETLVVSLFLLLIANIGVSEFLPNIGLEVGKFEGDWKGIYDQKNALGRVGALLIVSSMLLIFYSKDRAVQLYSFLALVSAIIVTLNTGSRTGFATSILVALITFVFGLVFYVLRSGFLYKRTFFAVLSAEFLMVCVLFFINTEMVGLFSSNDGVVVYDKFLSLSGRLTIWYYALSNMGDLNLLFGYGLGNFWTSENFNLFGPMQGMGKFFPEDSHNGYVDILIQGGLVTLFIYVVMLCFITKSLFKNDFLGFEEVVVCFSFIMLFVVSNITESYTTKSTNIINFIFVYIASFVFLHDSRSAKLYIFPMEYIRKHLKWSGK